MAAGAQAELRREIGPELDELRRQVADLQSLKEIQELRDLRDLHPKRMIGKNILGDEFSGGITGFLGLNEPLTGPTGSAGADAAVAASGGSALAADADADAPAPEFDDVPPISRGDALAAQANEEGAGHDESTSNGSISNGSANRPAVTNGAVTNGVLPPHRPPLMTKLAAPKVVGVVGLPKAPVRVLADGERPPFDPDGT